MMLPVFRQWRGSAVFSLGIWFILTPFMATIWRYNNGFLLWDSQPLLVRNIGQWLAEQGAFSFATEEVVYFSYGRYFFLVYLLLIIAAILVPPIFFERFLAAYWPNSPVLPMALAWATIGVHLSFSRTETAVLDTHT